MWNVGEENYAPVPRRNDRVLFIGAVAVAVVLVIGISSIIRCCAP